MAFSSLFLPKKSLITIDMGSQYLKVAQFKIVDRKPILTHFEMTSVPAQTMDKSILKDIDLIKEPLKRLFHKKMEHKNKSKVVMGVGGSSVLTRKLSVIKSDSKSVKKESILFEASQHLPFDIEETEYVTIDLPSMEDDDPNMDSVFFIAIKSEDINKYNQCNYDARIQTDVIFPSLLSLTYILSENYKNIDPSDYCLVLDIGFQTTGFHVIRNFHTFFSRELFVGTQSYTQEIQRRLGVSENEAQNLLNTLCKEESAPAEVMEIVQNHHASVAQEITTGMEYFHNYFSKATISRAYVTGGGRNVPDLISEISKRMHLDIENLQVFRKVQTKGFSKKKLTDLHSFAGICVGLALSQTVSKP